MPIYHVHSPEQNLIVDNLTTPSPILMQGLLRKGGKVSLREPGFLADITPRWMGRGTLRYILSVAEDGESATLAKLPKFDGAVAGHIELDSQGNPDMLRTTFKQMEEMASKVDRISSEYDSAALTYLPKLHPLIKTEDTAHVGAMVLYVPHHDPKGLLYGVPLQ